ncbi:MAG: hypothetical protein KGL39_46195 [Patescibacteria group bacterium]|nr:hypothetical protein [Patescibacteria group bacterium]
MKFRLRTIFILTALVALLLFIGSHLGIAGHWFPAERPWMGPSASFELSWDGCNIISFWWHPDGDDKMKFEFYWPGEQPPFA